MANDQSGNQYRRQPAPVNQMLEQGGRIPPQAPDVEEAVLGGMLIDHDAASIALQILKPDDFYKPANRYIYDTIQKLYERNNPLDLLTVENELRDQELLDSCGGSAYLAQLTRAVSSAANIEYHAQIIVEKAIKRNLILTCTEIIKDGYDTGSDPFDLLDRAEQNIFDLSNTKTRVPAKSISDILKTTIDHLVDIRGKADGLTGVPSSLDVDRLTAGWQNGDLIIIAARPSMGKTAFVLTAARNAALHATKEKKTSVAIFSLEMSDQSLVQRLLTMEARINAQMARSGRLNDQDFEQLVEAAGRLVQANIFIDDTPGISVIELRSKCRRLKNEHNIGLVIVDYLQLMTGGSGDRNREQEIAYISRGLKALAKELKVPVIALSQLSRAVEQRGGNKRPQLSDLRESGSIEQDADVVCFLYRPEYYGIQTDEEGHSTAGVAELIVGKQRNGPVGSVRLQFIKDYARFENLTTSFDNSISGVIESSEEYLSDPKPAGRQKSRQRNDHRDDEFDNPDDLEAPF
ncbi:MAG TPA: replicative DNA helicase [Balneolales bacterium]|nr:replicative DNA helicase [Balneolales bacterium]